MVQNFWRSKKFRMSAGKVFAGDELACSCCLGRELAVEMNSLPVTPLRPHFFPSGRRLWPKNSNIIKAAIIETGKDDFHSLKRTVDVY